MKFYIDRKLANELEYLRRRKGLKTSDVKRIINISSYSSKINGYNRFSDEDIKRLFDYLGISAELKTLKLTQ